MTDLIEERQHRSEMALPATASVVFPKEGFKLIKRRRKDYGALLGALWIAIIVLAAITANWLPLPDPNEVTAKFSAAPGWGAHLLGTDALGRDTLARCVFGARVSMAVAIGGTTISMVIGVTLGMVAGYFGGAVDSTISMFINFLLAFPPLVFLIALVAALRPSLTTLVLGLALLGDDAPHLYFTQALQHAAHAFARAAASKARAQRVEAVGIGEGDRVAVGGGD